MAVWAWVARVIKDYRTSEQPLREDLQRQNRAVERSFADVDRNKLDRWHWRNIVADTTAKFAEALRVVRPGLIVRLAGGSLQEQGLRILVVLAVPGALLVRGINGPINGADGDILSEVGAYLYEWDGGAWWRAPLSVSSGGGLPPVGPDGQFLGVSGGEPAWLPMPTELPPGGTNGQFLGRAAGVPAWLNLPLPTLPLMSRMPVLADTAALYSFDNTIFDMSGNAGHLSVLAGAARFTDVVPGYRGLYQRAADRLRASGASPAGILGDMTVEWIWHSPYLGSTSSNSSYLYYGVDSSGTAATNDLWGIEINVTAGELRWFQDSGTGTTAEYLLTGFSVPYNYASFMAVTRTSNIIQFYMNGIAIGAQSPTLVAPVGGSNSRMTVGGPTKSLCTFGDVRISNTSHTGGTIKDTYNAVMGRLWGPRP